MSLDTMLDKDLQEMLAIKEALGFSRCTYEPYLRQFIQFCRENYPDSPCITREIITKWIRIRPNESVNTQIRRISAIRSFTKYQASVGKDTFIPSSEYSNPQRKYIPYIFTDYEIATLFNSFDNIQPFYESPGREFTVPVLFRMMYCCGMRPSEPLKLKCADVSLDTGEIYIRQSKRRKDRHIYMSEDLLALCRKYDSLMGKREHFFQSPDGREYTTHWMTKQFRICWRNSGLDHGQAKPRPYALRHNFATRTMMKWLDGGRDIAGLLPYLSAYMGHSEYTYTLYYIHLLPERLVKTAGIHWEDFSGIYPDVEDGL